VSINSEIVKKIPLIYNLLILINILLIIFYVSLLVELIWFSVPSPASTLQLHKETNEPVFWFIISALGFLVFLVPLIYIICFSFNINNFSLNSSKLLLIIGAVLLIIGRLLTFTGGVQIKNHIKQKKMVVLDLGIFKFTRHPIAFGLMISVIGLNFILPSFIMIFLSIIFIFNLHRKVLIEEKILLQQFADAYEKYCKKTSRYL